MSKRNPTKSQRAVMELLDQGLPVEQIANSLGKSVLAVKKQLNRIKRRVREGRIDPSPLPIERAASEPRIYLAGFDVFRRDAKDHGEHLKQLCRDRGFVGLYPLDGQVPSSLGRQDAARWIYAANIELIRSADIVMANLDDFRGAASRTAARLSKLALRSRSASRFGHIGPPKRRSLNALRQQRLKAKALSVPAAISLRTSA